MLRLILTYQSPKDLNSITLTTPLLLRNSNSAIEDMIRALWIEHIKIAWKYDNDTNKIMLIKDHINVRRLYPLARSMLGSYTLLSTIEDTEHMFINNDEKDNDKRVTFFGQVGMDNRSVQSSVSFPIIPRSKRHYKQKVTRKSIDSAMTIVQKLSHAFEACSNILFDTKMDESYTDFSTKVVDYVYSSPFLYKTNTGLYLYYVLPRCVAYYEVTIKKTEINEVVRDLYNNDANSTRECIAIGLSTSNFERVKMLPGWDTHSYGYHSDDGGIYHGLGRQLSKFGPSFGQGDIVGCGIDYRDHSIFYTLNGRFLGKAFKEIKTGIELFPTVGIDANVTAEFNYGENIPFEFDLIAYMASLSFFLKAD